jgi:hypothetical protein
MKTVITDFTMVEEELFDIFSCVKKYHEGKLKNRMRIQVSLAMKKGVMCSIFSRKKV